MVRMARVFDVRISNTGQHDLDRFTPGRETGETNQTKRVGWGCGGGGVVERGGGGGGGLVREAQIEKRELANSQQERTTCTR